MKNYGSKLSSKICSDREPKCGYNFLFHSGKSNFCILESPMVLIFVFLFFGGDTMRGLEVTTGSAFKNYFWSLLRTYSEMCSGKPYLMLGIEPESAAYNANALPAVLSL